eukprot:TRINITY_DN81748_c0_g1_i1.p1 TRINITY_DN81748_c0_g1~~TRINITY_DN81748_c0_g1_i1.p1  ORF type:complete len:628 (+),score=139.68 TRINITY_DN81748_c0_g1_i1:88-1971(+)
MDRFEIAKNAGKYIGGAAVLYYSYKCLKSAVSQSFFFLDQDEQLVIVDLTTTRALPGPGVRLVSPFVKSTEKRKGILLQAVDYARVNDTLKGGIRVEVGPQLLFLGPYDELMERGQGYSLSPVEYCVVLDKVKGQRRIEKGPQIFMPGPYEELGPQTKAISLEANQYCNLVDTASGKKWQQKGEHLLFLQPTWKQSGVNTAISLKSTEYVRLVDTISGKIRVERGEQTVFPNHSEELLDGQKLVAINLKVFEYVKILDNATGEVRVEKGEQVVFLSANEVALGGGKKAAVEVDEVKAVRIRNKKTGNVDLITKKGLFFPQPEQEVEEVQQLIKLADYEAVILKNEKGELDFYYGDSAKGGAKPRSFFVPPYSELYTLLWSKGRRRENRTLQIQKIDCRPQFMNFEFNCRTNDNVELTLEGTFFWEIADVQKMVKVTGDTTGDICSHARSRFIQLVSKVTLKKFMEDFDSIAAQSYKSDDDFYEKRGIKIHSLEVSRYQCVDASTAKILEEIIQETTNRMNRLQQQESANEVGMFKLTGEIEQENLRGDLISVRQKHKKLEATGDGEAEAERVNTFIKNTGKEVPDLNHRIGLWNTLRKQEALEAVSSGQARIYFTPNDCNLSIETKE